VRSLPGALVALLVLAGCDSEKYVIGRFADEYCELRSSRLFCSSFERPDLGEWSDVQLERDASVEQTDERAYSGMGALHARSLGARSAAVVVQELTPVTEGELYLRAQLYVPKDLPTETMNLFFLGAVPTPDPFKGFDINLEDGALSIYSPQGVPDRVTGSLSVPRDTWFCLGVQVMVSHDVGSVRVLVDGELAVAHEAIDTLPDGGVHVLRAGVDWSSEQTEPFEVYIDDVVLDTQPIACPEP